MQNMKDSFRVLFG